MLKGVIDFVKPLNHFYTFLTRREELVIPRKYTTAPRHTHTYMHTHGQPINHTHTGVSKTKGQNFKT